MMIMMRKRQPRTSLYSFVVLCGIATLTTLLPVSLSANVNKNQQNDEESGGEGRGGYGIDVSAPIQHLASWNYDWLPHNVDPGPHNPVPLRLQGQPLQTLGHRHGFYLNYIEGCRKHYKEQGNNCDRFELDRMLMNQRQPQSMKNYTDVGFKKIRAPDNVVQLIQAFWKSNHYKGKAENWQAGNSYVSFCKADSYHHS